MRELHSSELKFVSGGTDMWASRGGRRNDSSQAGGGDESNSDGSGDHNDSEWGDLSITCCGIGPVGVDVFTLDWVGILQDAVDQGVLTSRQAGFYITNGEAALNADIMDDGFINGSVLPPELQGN